MASQFEFLIQRKCVVGKRLASRVCNRRASSEDLAKSPIWSEFFSARCCASVEGKPQDVEKVGCAPTFRDGCWGDRNTVGRQCTSGLGGNGLSASFRTARNLWSSRISRNGSGARPDKDLPQCQTPGRRRVRARDRHRVAGVQTCAGSAFVSDTHFPSAGDIAAVRSNPRVSPNFSFGQSVSCRPARSVASLARDLRVRNPAFGDWPVLMQA
jgi:hypothetical protein